MNDYCNKLELNIPPIREGANLFRTNTVHYRIDLADMHPDMKALLDSKGITVPLIEMFYRKAGNISSIHTDNIGGVFTKINWIYNGADSQMMWYKPKEHVMDTKKLMRTVADTEYYHFLRNEVTLEHIEKLSGSYLVHVGVPHQVTNPKEDRYCLCFVMREQDGSVVTMERAVELFAEFLV